MKKLIILFSAILIAAVTFYSCTKAGLGGEATIAAFPKHHEKPIPNTTLYIKYDAKDFPGTDVSVYDDAKIAIAEMGEDPHVHFENLQKGNYYIYGVGFDSAINQIVTGGIPVEIKEKAGETDIIVPVTE
ncbi:MAG: hypothetical protein IPO83_17450 [Chitinophagaceae bacterium]|nr:hypothetical protein [Chitinophagaceae bacterium]